VGAQDRQDRIGRRVVAEVGRDVADAERSVGVRDAWADDPLAVGVTPVCSLAVGSPSEAGVPAAALLAGFGLGALLKVEHHDQEAVGHRAVWVDCEAGAERRRRFVESAEPLVGDAEMLVGLRVVKLDGGRLEVALDGRHEVAEPLERIAQPDDGGRIGRAQGQRALVGHSGVGVPLSP
jgi:hypothetical protein